MIEYDKIKWDLIEEDSALNNHSGPRDIREWVSFVNQYMRLHIFTNNIKHFDSTFIGINHTDIEILMLQVLGTRFQHNAISAYRNADTNQLQSWFNNGIRWYPIQKTSEFFDRIAFCNLRNTEFESFEELETPKHIAGNLDIRGAKIESILGAPLYIGGTIVCCEKTHQQALQINEICNTEITIDTEYYTTAYLF